MQVGINVNFCNLSSVNNFHGFDFVELADFIFPQTLCDEEFMKKFYAVMNAKQYNIRCLEAPIRDVKPESGDPDILKITKKRFIKLIEIASRYNIKYVLFNTTFDPLVRFDFYTDMWVRQNKLFWEEIVPIAEKNNVVCLYCNVWDDTPDYLFEVFKYIDSSYFRFGMDIGHLHFISKVPMEAWFDKLNNFIEYICIHDNLGKRDDHLSIGEGIIDFGKVMSEIKKLNKIPDLCIQLFEPSKVQNSIDTLIDLLEKSGLLKEHEE